MPCQIEVLSLKLTRFPGSARVSRKYLDNPLWAPLSILVFFYKKNYVQSWGFSSVAERLLSKLSGP